MMVMAMIDDEEGSDEDGDYEDLLRYTGTPLTTVLQSTLHPGVMSIILLHLHSESFFG